MDKSKVKGIVDRALKHLGDFAYYEQSDDPGEEGARAAVIEIVLDALDEAGMVVSDKEKDRDQGGPVHFDEELEERDYGDRPPIDSDDK